MAALGALDTEIELKLRREGQRSAPATARCFLFTKCGFGRVLRGDCDSLQTSKQKLLPSRPTVTCLCLLRRCFAPRKPPPLAHYPRALSISHWPRIHLAQCAIRQHVHKQPTGRAFMYSSSPFPENIITPRVPEAPAHQANKQPLQDRQFPRKHSIPCLLAPGTRNTHSMEGAFCNSSKKRLSGLRST